MNGEIQGYKGKALRFLKLANAQIGDVIRIFKHEESIQGVLIPRSQLGDDKHVVIKLKNGYNVGIEVTAKTRIVKVGTGTKPSFSTLPPPKQKSNLPKITILSTGGTIASRVDYRTGGVRPALTANDLYSVVPELTNIAKIEAEILFSIFSENVTPKHWSYMTERIAKHIQNGADGVVVAHGTDTMGYTAAALSFSLQSLPVPVVLVGSQRSADRPSSDATANLIGAVTAAANAPFAEVVAAMHATVSDETIVFHRGTKVRKCHTSRRDAFKSINVTPLAKLEDGKTKMLTESYVKRHTKRRLAVKPNFKEKATMIKFYPGMTGKAIDWHVENKFKGIVLEGTGLGHVASRCFSAIKNAITKNVVVAMTSQCIWGRVNQNVYDTGRDLQKIGVIPLGDMLSETALVKMMWVLGQTNNPKDAEELLKKNIANELSGRTVFHEEKRK